MQPDDPLPWVSSPKPEAIRQMRTHTGITQARAARMLHVAKNTYQAWERGRRKMPPASWELFGFKCSAILAYGQTLDGGPNLQNQAG